MLKSKGFSRPVFLFFLLWLPSLGWSENYVYSEKESKVLFTTRHLGVVTLAGHFEKFSGAFQFDLNDISATTVTINIDAASLQSGDPNRNRSLKDKKFFWPDKYPEITFVSHKISDIEGEKFKIHGDLTIRGISKPAIFDTTYCCEVEDASGRKYLFFNAHTHIKRTDYRLGGMGIAGAAEFLAREDLQIELEVKGLPAKKLSVIEPRTPEV